LVKAAHRVLAERFPEIPVVVGTDAYFAELNRNRPMDCNGRVVCYSINPQVHAFDNLSLSETLEAQPWTVDSAHEIFGGQVVISPITLRPRFNPNATSAASRSQRETETDKRQTAGFAAAWTAGTIGALASHPQVASLTFFETIGPRGIMDQAGNAYSMFAVFQSITGMKTIAAGTSTHPRQVSAFGLTDGQGNHRLVLANMSPQVLVVTTEIGRDQIHEIAVEAESATIIPVENLG
jgi:hypothetical protein